MQKFSILSIVLAFMSITTSAKDINAWKYEKNLEQQFTVFKENLNFWNGNYFLNETQLTEFYTALTDTVSVLKNEIADKANKLNTLQNEINSTNKQLENTKVERDISIKNQSAIEVFGMKIHKSIYTLFMSLIILSLLIFTSIVYQLYKRSNKITIRTKQDYIELKEELESHKKHALERYAKLNAELHHTRMQLKRK